MQINMPFVDKNIISKLLKRKALEIQTLKLKQQQVRPILFK